MNPVAEVVKDYLIPGSAWFLLIAGSIGALLVWRDRTRRVGRTLLAGLFLLYWAMSVPLVAHALQLLQREDEPSTAAGERPEPAEPLPIVVLGNGLGGYVARGARFELPLGQTAMNTLFAVDRYRRYPAVVIASGGRQPDAEEGSPEAEVIRDGLLRNGIPAESIVLEPRSANTHEQAVEVSKILRERGAPRCVVVTSPQQMRRALDLFRREGIVALPVAAGSQLWQPSDAPRWWSWIVPSTEARAVSRDVIYELVAWPYYRMRGWID